MAAGKFHWLSCNNFSTKHLLTCECSCFSRFAFLSNDHIYDTFLTRFMFLQQQKEHRCWFHFNLGQRRGWKNHFSRAVERNVSYDTLEAVERRVSEVLSWSCSQTYQVLPHDITSFEFPPHLGLTFVCRKRLLAPDQVEELRALFCIYDTDGSGMIDMDELLEALPSVGYSTEEFRALFHTYDMDKNGLLDVEEFLSLMADVFQWILKLNLLSISQRMILLLRTRRHLHNRHTLQKIQNNLTSPHE